MNPFFERISTYGVRKKKSTYIYFLFFFFLVVSQYSMLGQIYTPAKLQILSQVNQPISYKILGQNVHTPYCNNQ